MTRAHLLAGQVGTSRRAARDDAAIAVGVGLAAPDRTARHQAPKIIGAGDRVAGSALPSRPAMSVELGRIDPLEPDTLSVAAESIAIDNDDAAA